MTCLDLRSGGAMMVMTRRRSSLAALAVAGLCLAIGSSAAGQVPALERFTVPAESHPMAVWSRRPAHAEGSVLLVHGRTWSSRPDFDLQVPGMQRSVLASLAARGLAAYAVDLRGYGETPRDASGWMTPRRATLDILAVLDWIARQHPSLPPPMLVGWSRGAALAMMAAQRAPDAVSALVMFGFTFDPDAEFVNGDTPSRPQRLRNTPEAAAADFISPRVTPRAVMAAFVAQALRADPVLADLRNESEFNSLDPAAVRVPTLLIYGERDPGIVPDDAAKLFARFRTAEKEHVVLRGADHAAQIEDTHDEWIDAVAAFAVRARTSR
jgi:pimeloyl-ACP methyl ester carboxylesterase